MSLSSIVPRIHHRVPRPLLLGMGLLLFCLTTLAVTGCRVEISTSEEGVGEASMDGDTTATGRAELRPETVSLSLRYEIQPGANTESLRYTILIPRSIAGRQQVREIAYSRRPDRIERRFESDYAIYEIKQPRETMTLDIRITADLLPGDLDAIENHPVETPAWISSPGDLRFWLRSENRIESNDPEIRKLALGAGSVEPVEQVRQLAAILKGTMNYTGLGNGAKGASRALAERSGDCTEFSDLFVALCRARGIPARTCDGILALPPRPGDTVKHSWAEVHLPDLGWVRLDPLLLCLGKASFERIPNAYLHLSHVRNDELLEQYSFDAYRYKGDPVTVRTSVILHDPADPGW